MRCVQTWVGVRVVQGWGWEGLACLQQKVAKEHMQWRGVVMAACRARHPFIEGVQSVAGPSIPHLVVLCVWLLCWLAAGQDVP